jgi:hypothetical protein
MIILSGPLKVLVAVKPVDFRNYAALLIMRSSRRRRMVFQSSSRFRLRITERYPVASIAINLSGGRNFPGLMPSGARAPSISSFSAGSARR